MPDRDSTKDRSPSPDAITFPAAPSSWGTVTGYTVWDVTMPGKCIAWRFFNDKQPAENTKKRRK